MSGIKLNSSSNIPSEYLPSVVLQRLDIPKDSIVFVINSETSEKEKLKITQSKKNLSDLNCKDSTPNHGARHNILSIEYICQRCHQSFETAELHSQHVLSHYSKKETESSDSEAEISRSKRRTKTHVAYHPYNSCCQFCQILSC